MFCSIFFSVISPWSTLVCLITTWGFSASHLVIISSRKCIAPGCILVKKVLQAVIRPAGTVPTPAGATPTLVGGFGGTGLTTGAFGAAGAAGAGAPPPRFNGARETPGEAPAGLAPGRAGSAAPLPKG